MSKLAPAKPFLLMFYGFPGSGKTYFSRQLSDKIHVAHVQADRIRYELFQEPRYDKQENLVVFQIVNYMVEEFLNAGVSVIYDMGSIRLAQRRMLRDLARQCGAEPILLWQQIDPDSALARVMKRDRRKSDDKYALQPDYTTFQKISASMQNPQISEDYIVLSGKHVFNTQYSAVLRYMQQRGIVTGTTQQPSVAKPGLVNLIPKTHVGRVDMSRRNIRIR